MRHRLALLALLLFAGSAALVAAQYGIIALPFDLAAPRSVDAPTVPSEKTAASGPTAANTPASDVTAALGNGVPPAASGTLTGGVSLDISRVSPNGSSVFAGQAKPNEYVTVLEAGKPVGSVKADANGEWSLVTEHRFASLEPQLSFETGVEPPKQLAAAPPANGADKSGATAPTVTAELMKKLEGLVSQAREDAKKDPQSAAASPSAAATSPAAPETPAASASPVFTPSGETPAAVAARSDQDTLATIPLPIMFVYNEVQFTSEGQRAVDLLLEYLKLKHLTSISLSGHADERGSGPFNMDLSRERLDTVARHLREGGFSGKLDLVPKGETEPFSGVDRGKYAEGELFQLDRRVELRVVR